MKFSVYLPTYNRATFLNNAIDSVLSQGEFLGELIIANNASTDGTEELVQSYDDKRIKYLHYEELVGLWENHNRSLSECYYDWVVYVHSDEVLEEGALHALSEVISNNPPAEPSTVAIQLQADIERYNS